MRKIEHKKLNFCLSKCRIYEVFIYKNKTKCHVGQLQFTDVKEHWKIYFSITKIDRDLIDSHFDLKRGDSGFFLTAKRTENDFSIKINILDKLLKFFSNADLTTLERNYNF